MWTWSRKPKSVWVRGEDEAAGLMRRAGCAILARNLRLPMGEIDLLCREKKSGTVVIVEVKAREYSEDDRVRISPTANINHAKQQKLRTLARAIKKDPKYRDAPIRIDAIGVIFAKGRRAPVEIKHYIGAVRDES
ncbi:MAG: YraN family protein [Phycisphaerales bacterium]|nr:YraN family protein [Phycisphaerales bacterium]